MTDYRLPVLAIVKRSYGYVWEHRTLFMAPILLVFFFNFIGTAGLFVSQTPGKITIQSVVFGWACLIATGLVSTSFVVGVHRTVLLGETRSGIAFLRWGSNLSRYVGTLLLLGLFCILIAFTLTMGLGVVLGIGIGAMAGGMGPIIGAVLGASVVTYFIAAALLQRLMLSLPAAAIGAQDRFALSWQATRGNWIRLIGVSILIFLPPASLGLLFDIRHLSELATTISTGTAPSSPDLVFGVMRSALVAITTPVFAVMLSLCYDVLVRGGSPTEVPTHAEEDGSQG